MFNDYLDLSLSISEDPYDCTGEITSYRSTEICTVKKFEYNDYLKEFPEDDLNTNKKFDSVIYKFITTPRNSEEPTEIYCILNFYIDRSKLVSIEFRNKNNDGYNYKRNVYQRLKPSAIDTKIADIMIICVETLSPLKNNVGYYFKSCQKIAELIVKEICVKLTEKVQKKRTRHYNIKTKKCSSKNK